MECNSCKKEVDSVVCLCESCYDGTLTTCTNLLSALTLAQEVGQYWRKDWSGFDGRTLRDQMSDLGAVASGTLKPEHYRENWGLDEPDGD